MDRTIVAVFSGTGNARRAAGIVAAELERSGRSVELVDLAAGAEIPALGKGDLLALCSSTLGFSPPVTVMQRLHSAPRSDGARAAMLCVCGGTMKNGTISGGWSGAASIVALGVLKRKGWQPAGSADASYPENWTQMTEAARGDARAAIIERGDRESRAFGQALAEDRQSFVRRNVLTLTIGRFIGFFFRLAASKILGSMYIADDTCTSCGLCERTCPAHAIVMVDGTPRWTTKCCDCNRCINVCPSSSIQTSTARLAIFSVVNVAAMMGSPALARWFLEATLPSSGGALHGITAFALGVLVYGGITALQLGPLDLVMRKLERKPALRRFFTASFTRRYERYLAPGFKPATRGH